MTSQTSVEDLAQSRSVAEADTSLLDKSGDKHNSVDNMQVNTPNNQSKANSFTSSSPSKASQLR